MSDGRPLTTLRSPSPPPDPKRPKSGECVYCGRTTTRFQFGVWACSWCDDLPGKEAL